MYDNDILQLEELSRKEQVKKDLEQIRRPSLMRRIGSGLLDLLFIFVALALIELFAAAVIFRPLGYYDAQSNINKIFAESGLYLQQNGLNIPIGNAYDDNKSVEENYDVPITKFYTEHPLGSLNDNLSKYTKAKLDSKLYTINSKGELVRTADADENDVKKFYVNQYEKALNILSSDPVYISSANKTFNIMVYSMLISFVISAGVFYFLIPLLRKNGETLGQIICKICLMDASRIGKVKKMQLILRSLIVVVVNFLIPFWGFVFFSHITLITVLVSFAMMCLVKYNRGVQDFASQTQVVMKFESFRWMMHEHEGAAE